MKVPSFLRERLEAAQRRLEAIHAQQQEAALRLLSDVDDAVAEILRRKTPAERVDMAMTANRLMRLRIEGHLRTIHPDWDAAAIQAEIARRMLLGSGR